MTTPEPVQVFEGQGSQLVTVPLEKLYAYVEQCIQHPGMQYWGSDRNWMLEYARGFQKTYRVLFDFPLSQSINTDFWRSLGKEAKRRFEARRLRD